MHQARILRGMQTHTVVLAGTVVVEGVAFRWRITHTQQLAVSNPRLGTRVAPLSDSPETQARDLARAILVGEGSAPNVDAVEDLPA